MLTALAGIVNIASALTPDIRWRGHLLLKLEGVHALQVFHALALPAGAALLLIAPYLLKRRRRAMQVAVTLLVAIGLVNLLKGLDYEECAFGWIVALLLYAGRKQFTVIHSPITFRSAIWRVPVVGALGLTLVGLTDWLTSGRPKFDAIVDESTALMRFKRGQLHFENHTLRAFGHVVSFQWMPLAIHFVEVATLLGMAYILFRPLAAPKSWPGPAVRRRAVQLVRRTARTPSASSSCGPTSTTSSTPPAPRSSVTASRPARCCCQEIRWDRPTSSATCCSSCAASRDREDSSLLRSAPAGRSCRSSRASACTRSTWATRRSSIPRRSRSRGGRSARCASRSAVCARPATAPSCARWPRSHRRRSRQMETVLEAGRIGKGERGFSMCMDGVDCANQQDTLFVLARDGERKLRGVLHFVPCYGRKAMSLSIMRRDPATPNGLMEFLVVSAIEGMRERGIEELSLNFAALTKTIRDPENAFERVLGRAASALDAYLQVESLYRFNVKFQPRWNPRYLVYEGRLGLVRAALAAMWAEGQMPKPRLPRLQARAYERTLETVNR